MASMCPPSHKGREQVTITFWLYSQRITQILHQRKKIYQQTSNYSAGKNFVDCSAFVRKNSISNEQILLLLIKENLDYIGFALRRALRRGIIDEQVLIILIKNNLGYTSFAASKSISNEQILVALAKSDQDYQKFALSKEFSDEHTLITLMKAEVNIKPFITAKNISNTQIINITQNSCLPLQDKFNLLQQILPVDIQQERENINNSLIKHEYDRVNDRVLKFVNYQQRELLMEIVFKEAVLQQKKNEMILLQMKQLS
ncbi:Hypothetical_protein [Hexamita inflata]|uniref:Hypothetical_protein n=1 Tax=Hexamita inflata TaxID=28002 RepID=A0AA86U1B4_9EUKA|nr:Hypothetical protein HINF_LOCUS24164 [Hexamita inflata]